MADVIKKEDVDRLVQCVKNHIESDELTPVAIIKAVMHSENCSLAEAKEAYSLASRGESLGEYQERIFSEIFEKEEDFENFKIVNRIFKSSIFREFKHNNAHQARPQAGWTSVPVLVLRLSLTLPQNHHLHYGPCGRR